VEALNHAKPLAGGHATMYDIPNDTTLQSIIARQNPFSAREMTKDINALLRQPSAF